MAEILGYFCRCFIPECETFDNTTFYQTFLDYTTPKLKPGNSWEWDSCNRYSSKYTLCHPKNFAQDLMTKCSDHVFDKSIFQSTTVTEVNQWSFCFGIYKENYPWITLQLSHKDHFVKFL